MFDLIKEIDSRWETEKRYLTSDDNGKMKQGSNTIHSTKKLTMRVTNTDTDKPILAFDGGPTGFERYCLNDITLEGDGEFCICAGTPNRWPACYVDMPTVREFIDRYKATVEIS